jgi:DNA-binding response OmpR family regulator
MTRPAPPARRRIAVVDDEPDVLTFLRLALEDAGYEVLASSSPVSVIPELLAFSPDLVCLDLLMPERMGLSLFVEIRRTAALRQVPVVILSGLAGASRPLEGLAFDDETEPPAAYLEKPVDLPALLALVRRLTADAREASQ